MQEILETLRDTLDKTFLTNLRGFLSLHHGAQDFVIASDYCVGDKGKPNDVMAFTVVPRHMIDLNELAHSLPRDIKKTKEITEEISGALNSTRYFHVAFMLDDIRGVMHSPRKCPQAVALQNMVDVIEMLDMWIRNQPGGAEKFGAQLKKFKIAEKELKKRSVNIKLFKHVSVASILASILALYISKEAFCQSITWVHDRDKIHEAFGAICFDLFEINHWGACLQEVPENRIPRVGYFVDTEGGRNLWYDPLIRLPDYIAGTVASWNMRANLTTADKHARLLEQVIADNPHCHLIKIDMSQDLWKFGLRPVGRI